jgi:hypothetical protein
MQVNLSKGVGFSRDRARKKWSRPAGRAGDAARSALECGSASYRLHEASASQTLPFSRLASARHQGGSFAVALQGSPGASSHGGQRQIFADAIVPSGLSPGPVRGSVSLGPNSLVARRKFLPAHEPVCSRFAFLQVCKGAYTGRWDQRLHQGLATSGSSGNGRR